MGSDDKIFAHEYPFQRFIKFCSDIFEKPVIWFRENVVVPNRPEYYWYHEKLRRVPTIDQCYTDDLVCVYEADEQFKRDRQVDKYILTILKKRFDYCQVDNLEDKEGCKELQEVYEQATNNYFIKYGDMGVKASALMCLMKQKNRMAWERRHGPVGSGRKPPEEHVPKVKKPTC